MVVKVADHPFVFLGQFEVGLPEAVAVLTLEAGLTPDSSWSWDWIVQSGFVEEFVDGCVSDRLLGVVA